MIDIKTALKTKIKSIIDTWDEEDIYAISFFVYSNEVYEYNGFSNVSEFMISYNAESDCEGAGELDEERWNYAFWRQNEEPIIYTSYALAARILTSCLTALTFLNSSSSS